MSILLFIVIVNFVQHCSYTFVLLFGFCSLYFYYSYFVLTVLVLCTISYFTLV